MSNVTLKIGGRDYTVACAEGEEGHVRALGAMIADKVAEMGSSAQGETRQLLFAALLLADQDAIVQAIHADFGGRSLHQTRMSDLYATLETLKYARDHVAEFMKPEKRRVNTPLALFGARARVEYQPKEENILAGALLTWLPMLFLLGIFFFFMRQLQASGGKAMSFGKSKARLLNESQNKVTFADVAGIDEAKDDLQKDREKLREERKAKRPA